jgi:hypothetical protein
MMTIMNHQQKGVQATTNMRLNSAKKIHKIRKLRKEKATKHNKTPK